MVAFSKNTRLQRGTGILDSLMKPFTVNKYGNEAHARSLDPKHFMQGYTWIGPHTEVKKRDLLGDNVALNDLDRAGEAHDRSFLKEKEKYQQDRDLTKHMKNIHRADDVFINRAMNSRDDPIMGKITGTIIGMKKQYEQATGKPSKFSGLDPNIADESPVAVQEGSGDPVARLRSIAQQYRVVDRKEKKRLQKGGVLPLIPIGIAVAGTIASKLASDLYDFVKKKVTSGGGRIPYHKTQKQKIEFLKDFVNSI